jgi:hypothetical protein
VDTIATLRAIDSSNIPDSFLVLLDGFALANDGGGGIFVWRATSTDNDNGGTVVRPNSITPADPDRWLRHYTGAINVRWFGAGLGAADDAPLIQRAVGTAIHTSAFRATVIGVHNETLPIPAMRVSNPNCSPLKIRG